MQQSNRYNQQNQTSKALKNKQVNKEKILCRQQQYSMAKSSAMFYKTLQTNKINFSKRNARNALKQEILIIEGQIKIIH